MTCPHCCTANAAGDQSTASVTRAVSRTTASGTGGSVRLSGGRCRRHGSMLRSATGSRGSVSLRHGANALHRPRCERRAGLGSKSSANSGGGSLAPSPMVASPMTNTGSGCARSTTRSRRRSRIVCRNWRSWRTSSLTLGSCGTRRRPASAGSCLLHFSTGSPSVSTRSASSTSSQRPHSVSCSRSQEQERGRATSNGRELVR